MDDHQSLSLQNSLFPACNGTIESFDPQQILTNAPLFQFKAGGDAKGVTRQLRSTREWQEAFQGICYVWESLNGTLYIADGHQRLGLAQRLKLKPDGTPIRLNAIRFKEAEGWTVQKMRVFAAAKNIAEGGESTKPMDVAKLLRNGGPREFLDTYIPPSRLCYRWGCFLANLGEDAFKLVVNNVVPEAWGIIVGEMVSDPEQQVTVFDGLRKQKPKADSIRDLVVEMLDAGFSKTTQTNLFGEIDVTASLIIERITIFRACRDILKSTIEAMEKSIQVQHAFDQASSPLNVGALDLYVQQRRIMLGVLPQARRRGEFLSECLTRTARDYSAMHSPQGKSALIKAFVSNLEGFCKPLFPKEAKVAVMPERLDDFSETLFILTDITGTGQSTLHL